MRIFENELCYSCREAAFLLKCSNQTIWRYATTQIESRKMRYYRGERRRYYIPESELWRFRDEIRPTFQFGGLYGRPMGCKDKKPRKPKAIPFYDAEEQKLSKMNPYQRVNYMVRRANKLSSCCV